MKEALRRPFIYCIALTLCLLTFAQCNGNQTRLKLLAKAMNLTMPQDMGDGISFEKIAIVGENEMRYYFKMEGLTPELATPMAVKNIKNDLMLELIASKDMDEFRKMKTKLSYEYQDKDGNPLMEIDMTHDEYTVYTPVEITTYDQLQDVALKSVKMLPSNVDDQTRLDSIVAHEPNILKYRYTVDAKGEKAMKAGSWKKMQNTLRDHVLHSAEASALRDIGTEFRYVYYNESGAEIGAAIFSPEDYKN